MSATLTPSGREEFIDIDEFRNENLEMKAFFKDIVQLPTFMGVKFMGRTFKYAIRPENGVVVFESINLSDLNLTSLTQFTQEAQRQIAAQQAEAVPA